MATKQKQPETHKHHYIRTPIAAFFGTLALVFVVLSVLMFWVNRTLTNTDVFVGAVSSMSENPEVQDFIATEASKSLIESAPIEDLSKELLDSQQITLPPDQQQTLVEEEIKGTLLTAISSDEFQTAWKDSSQDLHSQIVSQLDSDSNQIELDLKPTIDSFVKQLEGTELDQFSSEFELDPGEAVIKIDDSNIENVHTGYQALKNGFYAFALIALIFVALATVISVHHLKTLRRISLATGIILAIIYVITKLPTYITINADDQATSDFVKVLSEQVFSGFQTILLILIVIFVGFPIISKAIEIYQSNSKKPSK